MCIEVLGIIFVVKITELISYWTLQVLNTKDESLSIVAAEKINIWGENGVGRWDHPVPLPLHVCGDSFINLFMCN